MSSVILAQSAPLWTDVEAAFFLFVQTEDSAGYDRPIGRRRNNERRQTCRTTDTFDGQLQEPPRPLC